MLVYQRVSPESTLKHTNKPLTKPHLGRDVPGHVRLDAPKLFEACDESEIILDVLENSRHPHRLTALVGGPKKTVLSAVIEDSYDSGLILL